MLQAKPAGWFKTALSISLEHHVYQSFYNLCVQCEQVHLVKSRL